MATRPHSEHSLSAMRSLLRMVEVMVKRAGSGVVDEEGTAVAATWMSESAVTVFATTCNSVQSHLLRSERDEVHTP